MDSRDKWRLTEVQEDRSKGARRCGGWGGQRSLVPLLSSLGTFLKRSGGGGVDLCIKGGVSATEGHILTGARSQVRIS